MSPDQYETLAHDERTAFCKLFGSLRKVAEIPLTDTATLTEHRRCAAAMRARWENALKRLDAEASRVVG